MCVCVWKVESANESVELCCFLSFVSFFTPEPVLEGWFLICTWSRQFGLICQLYLGMQNTWKHLKPPGFWCDVTIHLCFSSKLCFVEASLWRQVPSPSSAIPCETRWKVGRSPFTYWARSLWMVWYTHWPPHGKFWNSCSKPYNRPSPIEVCEIGYTHIWDDIKMRGALINIIL